jgi:hypothetical protein
MERDPGQGILPSGSQFRIVGRDTGSSHLRFPGAPMYLPTIIETTGRGERVYDI